MVASEQSFVSMPVMRKDSHKPRQDAAQVDRPAPGRGVPPASEREWMTTEEVASRLRTHYRTVARWASDGLIRVAGGGHGDPWRWSEKNFREAFVLARLRTEGFSRQEVRSAMGTLEAMGHNPFSKGKFLVLETPRKGSRNRGTFVKIMDTGEAIALSDSGGAQMLLPFPNAPWTPEGKTS